MFKLISFGMSYKKLNKNINVLVMWETELWQKPVPSSFLICR
jgi:hypothetical protein